MLGRARRWRKKPGTLMGLGAGSFLGASWWLRRLGSTFGLQGEAA
jgi:hypothetical protein